MLSYIWKVRRLFYQDYIAAVPFDRFSPKLWWHWHMTCMLLSQLSLPEMEPSPTQSLPLSAPPVYAYLVVTNPGSLNRSNSALQSHIGSKISKASHLDAFRQLIFLTLNSILQQIIQLSIHQVSDAARKYLAQLSSKPGQF